jgi:transcriptional regulator with XRE-family HTH domain
MKQPSTLGETIAQHRARLGLTQHALAAKVGVHPLAVSRWETGRANPSHEHRAALAELLGIDPADLGVLTTRADALTEPPAWAAQYHEELLARLHEIEVVLIKINHTAEECCDPPYSAAHNI